MIRLAIQGHNTRGKEVIEILEMLGGKTSYECSYKDGFDSSYFFFINTDENFSIDGLAYNNEELKNYYIFTLEEFLEKFPYKVGDIVIIKRKNKKAIVDKVVWCCDTITYWLKYDDMIEGNWRVEHLQPYEEETVNENNEEKMPYRANLRISGYTELEIPESFDINIKGNIVCLTPKTLEKLKKDKFDISTLKPFDKVLVRIFHKEEWKADFFSHYTNDADHPFVTVGKHALCYCIPYENNEHLLGKTDDCDEYYKIWE